MVITGTLPALRGLLLFPPQMLGGMVAAALVSCMFPGPLVVETSLNQGTSSAQGVFIEMFLTAELVFTVLMLAAEKSKATFIAPVGIGLALFVAELAGECPDDYAIVYRGRTDGLFRSVLHRRLSQSHSIFRSLRRKPQLSKISLDILGWPFPWCSDLRRLLQVRQTQQL